MSARVAAAEPSGERRTHLMGSKGIRTGFMPVVVIRVFLFMR